MNLFIFKWGYLNEGDCDFLPNIFYFHRHLPLTILIVLNITLDNALQ